MLNGEGSEIEIDENNSGEMPDLTGMFPGFEDSASETGDDNSATDDADKGGADTGLVGDDWEESEKADDNPVLTIDPRLLMEASKAGMSYDDCLELGSEKAVRACLKFAQKGQEAGGEKATDKKPADTDLDLFNAPEINGDLDENIASVIGSMSESTKQAFTKFADIVNGKLSTLMETVNSQMETIKTARVDSAVDSLGDKWASIFGNSEEGLNPEHAEARKRLHVAIEKLSAVESANGTKSPIGKLVRQAAAIEFPNVAKEQARSELVNKASSRPKIRKPSEHKTEATDPETAAMRLIESGLREMGASRSAPAYLP